MNRILEGIKNKRGSRPKKVAEGILPSSEVRLDAIPPPSPTPAPTPSHFLRVSRQDMVRRRIDFLNDDPATMTYARQAALYLLRRYRWYNPRLSCTDRPDSDYFVEMGEIAGAASGDAGDDGNDVDDDEGSFTSFNRSMLRSPSRREQPCLEKAWAFFEHVTLPRHLDHSSHLAVARSSSLLDGLASGEDRGLAEKPGGPSPPPPPAGKKSNVAPAVPFGEWLLCHVRGSDYEDVYDDEEVVIMDLAEPGEDRYPTSLYSPVWTPMNQMGDFGLGMGLYFIALRSITILTFIAGLINIPNMIYFASNEYSNGQEGVDISLKGSAVCTMQKFVPCPTCSIDNFANVPHRIATASNFYGDDNLVFVVKNFCDGAKLSLALVNYVTLLFVIVGMVYINRHLKQQEVKFDEDEQTAQDYSITIKNPPPNATDPDEWKAFFDSNFGPGVHTTCCTVARDNYLLVRALVRRRELLQRLKWKLPPGTPLDVPRLADIAKDLEDKRNFFGLVISLVFPDVLVLLHQLKEINEEVKGLSVLEFPATRIFVTFETEAAQRNILKCLSIGSKAILKNSVLQVNPDHLFRSNLVLNVKEAEEPSTIRWQDLCDREWDRVMKMLLTAFAWACSVALVAFTIEFCRHRSSVFAAYAIAIFNKGFPDYAKILVNFESHRNEAHRETSLYVKIAAFRWINTALIVTLITPFPSTLTSGNDNLLDGVCEIFVAEIITSNLIKFADPEGFIKRHYLAPRAGSQEEMNRYMHGKAWHLAERYSSMSKILFLTLWYCSVYPFAFFLCSLTFFIDYFAERFSLMRTWKHAPRLGSHTSSFSRRYVFPLAMAAMAVASSYFWAGFPYDDLCENDGANSNDDDAMGDYVGSWNVLSADGSRSVAITVSEGDPSYRFCEQSLFWYGKVITFPAIPFWQREGEEWMTEEQELLTTVYGWTSLFLLLCACLWIIKLSIYTVFFRSNYKSRGEDQGIPFSHVATISSYIPEVSSDLFSYPLLAVDTHGVNEELYEWKDPEKPYSYYDLTRDAREVLKESMMPEDEIKLLFSTVKHWPPDEGVLELQLEKLSPHGEYC